MAKTEQLPAFPEEDKLRKLSDEINACYARVGRKLGEIKEFGQFFKLSSDYFVALNETTVKDIDELILENVRFGKTKAEKLVEILAQCAKEITDARTLAAKFDEKESEFLKLNNLKELPPGLRVTESRTIKNEEATEDRI